MNVASQKQFVRSTTSAETIWIASQQNTPFQPTKSKVKVPEEIRNPLYVVSDPQTKRLSIAPAGQLVTSQNTPSENAMMVRAALPGMYPELLGSGPFRSEMGLRFAYVGGSMARGIASVELVCQLAEAGCMGFFGSAGLKLAETEQAIDSILHHLGNRPLPWGVNLIHSPTKPELEQQLVELLLRMGVQNVEASAFMDLQRAVIQYTASGLHRDSSGKILRKNRLFAKISRPEVARHFLLPPPQHLLDQLVQAGLLQQDEAVMALELPVAHSITIEADSGGHTDNRPLGPLISCIRSLQLEVAQSFPPATSVYIGAAGGLGTPESVAAAFATGADYVLVGTVHQASVEANISSSAKEMLAQAGFADIGMTASADMFEQGVKVQVLTRGTLMAARGNLLYQVYRDHESLDDIPTKVRDLLERTVFGQSLENSWQQTRERGLARDPLRIAAAEANPKLKMAMVFRSYLGKSSRWPIEGTSERRLDYQIWCGSAMGAFNDWVKGSFLEPLENRFVNQIALNLMEGAATHARLNQLRQLGVPIVAATSHFKPRPLEA